MDSTDDQTYYLRRQGRVDGPWPLEKLLAEVKLQKLGRHHEISVDRLTWSPAGNLPRLFPKIEIRKTLQRSGHGPAGDIPLGEIVASMASAQLAADAPWHYSLEGQQLGPVDLNHLAELLRSGQLRLDSLVWTPGMNDWAPAERVPELMVLLEGPIRANSTNTAATQFISLTPAPSGSPLAYWSVGVGVASLLLSCFPLVGALGVVAIALGLLARRESSGNLSDGPGPSWAISGIVLGTVSILMTVLSLIVWLLYQ